MMFVTIGLNNPNCDYVMDGIHDEIELQAAIDFAAIANMGVKVEDGIVVKIEADLEIKAPIYGKFTLSYARVRVE